MTLNSPINGGDYEAVVRDEAVDLIACGIADLLNAEMLKHGKDPYAIAMILLAIERAARMISKKIDPAFARVLAANLMQPEKGA